MSDGRVLLDFPALRPAIMLRGGSTPFTTSVWSSTANVGCAESHLHSGFRTEGVGCCLLGKLAIDDHGTSEINKIGQLHFLTASRSQCTALSVQFHHFSVRLIWTALASPCSSNEILLYSYHFSCFTKRSKALGYFFQFCILCACITKKWIQWLLDPANVKIKSAWAQACIERQG